MARPRPAFAMVELLVVISIVALLIALLLPAIKNSRESARRVMCASRQRQIGLGLVQYAQDHLDFSPPLHGYPDNDGISTYAWSPSRWRGLGLLYAEGGSDYLSAREIRYCPTAGRTRVVDAVYGWPADPADVGVGVLCGNRWTCCSPPPAPLRGRHHAR